jgi:hypothetical protein
VIAYRLGVTGHRHLAGLDAVGAAVDDVLGVVEQAAGDRPCTVVSCLAEGADRLVARRALARPEWSLDVILPLAADDYETDFPATADEFRALLGQASSVLNMPPAPSRVDAYLAAGLRLVSTIDRLVAVWDGEPAEGPGGTAEIVLAARRRALPVDVVPVTRARR